MKTYLCTLLILLSLTAQSQTHLDTYIQEGLENNQMIKQQEFALEKSMYALKEAQSMFLPKVMFQSDYFLAGGGRTVDFPAGDILNPVYATLNQLTQNNNFPMVENQRILLNPNNFYDVKVRTTLPIINAEIAYNRRIKSNQVTMQQLEILVYQRELVKDIKSAYYNFLKTLEAIRIYESAIELVTESKRVNEVLFNNGIVNKTVLLRAENELIKFQSQYFASVQQSENAKAYFNFLLNKNLIDDIEIDDIFLIQKADYVDERSYDQREELIQLNLSTQINQQQLKLSKAYLIPSVGAFLDLGSQAFDWEYNSQSRYYFFGVSLQWNIFSGGLNRYVNKQAQMDKNITISKIDQVSEQLRMQLLISQNNYEASQSDLEGANKQMLSAERAYRDSMKLYKEAQILFIELLDAQNQWVSAQLQQSISLYDCYIKATEIERASASFNLKYN
ncbi:TolC family protein [Belliella sp. DSM 107340]|uniref:TolC family protein n=1 Tax=Belliella calami TaxID=2923436 RepID=A0ABS9UJG4_9BACT|nr:TolC family protein [Belliella calami]MCH7396757.1 TolC family protein [Belliella calami]